MPDDRTWWDRLGVTTRADEAPDPPVAVVLDPAEIEALALAARLMARTDDPALSAAARRALARLGDAVAPDRRAALGLDADFARDLGEGRDASMPAIATALRRRRKLRLIYGDAVGRETARTVWPIAVVVFEHARILAAWCELRADHRHFRLDRMIGVHVSTEPLPRSREALFATWRETVAWMEDRPMTT